MKVSLLFSFSLLLSSLSLASSLRIVQYNVEWLFTDYYAPADCPGNGCSWASLSNATTHLSAVADILRTLNPDLVSLCEVEGISQLEQLNDAIQEGKDGKEWEEKENEGYNSYLIPGNDTSTGQNVGLLVTKPYSPSIQLVRTEQRASYPIDEIGKIQCGATDDMTGTVGVSKHYITEFQLGSVPVVLVGAHLLAYPTDPARCVEREAQAKILQQVMVSALQEGKEIILLGDLNDYDEDVLDVEENRPTSRVLDILKGKITFFNFSYSLVSVLDNLSSLERYSDWYSTDCLDNHYSLIDHVLVSPNLATKVANAFIYHGYEEYCGKWVSDHYPVVVDFNEDV